MFRFDQYNYCQLSKGRNESVLNNMHCADWYNVIIYKCKRERENYYHFISMLCHAFWVGHSVFVPFNSSVPLFTIHTKKTLEQLHVYYLSLMTMSLLFSNFEFKFQRK